MSRQYRLLSRSENQALGIGQYALDFLSANLAENSSGPAEQVLARTELFHLDSVACAVAALASGANAPVLLRQEALGYPLPAGTLGATVFGSFKGVSPEKAVLANASAVRELDSNGTNFGFNARTGYTRGEFGHNDFYPVVIAAAQQMGCNGRRTLLAMLCLDEIRGRLAEVFSLKDYKIDHVLHGAIASAAVYGALLGGTAEQIESAIGLVVAHFVPFRAIRHGEQLSDSKGASAAISAEVAVQSMRRALRGFTGPGDIFRNPQAVFCLFEPPAKKGESPFDLELALTGDDFAISGMHFKLGLYEHQSAGAIQGLFELLAKYPQILLGSKEDIQRLEIVIYEPAFSIIGDPHKQNPQTRQSADHSMLYIIGTLLRKALDRGPDLIVPQFSAATLWKELILLPEDYSDEALQNAETRQWMKKIEFKHGGPEFDQRYPDGIPTAVKLNHATLGELDSGLVMYPAGHARYTGTDLPELLQQKFLRLAGLGVRQPSEFQQKLSGVAQMSSDQIAQLYSFEIRSCSDC